MNYILLSILCVEAAILLALALLKKITKKMFFLIAGISIVFVLASIAFLAIGKNTDNKTVDEKEYIYMAAILTQNDYPDKALTALNQIIESDEQLYDEKLLKALDYNMQGAYLLAEKYLVDTEGEMADAIVNASAGGVIVEDEIVDTVTNGVIEKLALSDEEAARYKAQLQLRYSVNIGATAEDSIEKDAWMTTAELLDDVKYDEAYLTMLKEAEKGDIKDGIIVAHMYSNNYSNITLGDDDIEYDELLKNITDEQVKLNRDYIGRDDEETDESEEIPAIKESIDELDTAINYDYRFSLNRLNEAKVKRSINYLAQFEPSKFNVGYNLEMARLYYGCNDREKTDEYLEKLFLQDRVNSNMWLGSEIVMLNDILLEEMSGGKNGSFELLFRDIMGSMYQGIFVEDDINGFCAYVKKYLNNKYKGIDINNIDVSQNPKISVNISPGEGVDLEDVNTLSVVDTGVEINDFEIEKREVEALSVCYVLDRSGSMSGNRMIDSKDAIRRSILTVKDGTQVGLVSFESSARTDSEMTYSKYMVTSALEGINASGGTYIAEGLDLARKNLSKSIGNKIIILVSDGQDGSRDKIDDILAQVRSEGITVYTIGITGCDEAYLTKIADATGGKYISVDNTAEMTSIFSQISNNITNAYYLTYSIDSEEEAGGSLRDRYVEIRVKDTTVRAKKKYKLVQEEIVESNKGGSEQETKTEQSSDYYHQNGTTKGGRLYE